MASRTSTELGFDSDGQRGRSEIRFPSRNLADSLAVAKAIHDYGGGRATADQLAAFLGYKSTSNGAYLARVGSARLFGLVMKVGEYFQLTPLAQMILMPTYPEQRRQGMVEAFLQVELFGRVFDDFKGRELPPEVGMKNALRNVYKVVPTRIDIAYRSLMDSAQDAGFFDTRNARTHLIMPTIQTTTSSVADGQSPGASDDADDRLNPSPAEVPQDFVPVAARGQPSLTAVKAKYLEALIKLFEEKSKGGDLDEKLMERIEKLLDGK